MENSEGNAFIIGNPELFSINVFVDDCEPRFGRLSLSCGGEKIGDETMVVLLNTVIAQFESKAERYDSCLANELTERDKYAVYAYIEEGYSQANDWETSERLGSVWLTLDLSPSLDGDFLVLLSSSEKDRVIWKKFGGDEVNELTLPAGYVMDKVAMLLVEFAKIL